MNPPLTRREVLAGMAAAPFLLQARGAGAATPVRPNIVVVILDDVHPSVWPRLKWLWSRRSTTGWARFGNAFLDCPICAPSRVTFLSGIAEQHHHVSSNDPAVIEAWHESGGRDRTIGPAFKAGGYATAYAGKYLNGFPWSLGQSAATEGYVPPGWDRWHCFVDSVARLPSSQQGATYASPWLNADGVLVRPPLGDAWATSAHVGATPSARAARAGDSGYITDHLNVHARSLVGGVLPEPFLLVLGNLAPHDAKDASVGIFPAAAPAQRHAAKGFSQAPTVATDPAYGEVDLSDKPAWLQGEAPTMDTFDAAWRADLVRRQLQAWRAAQAVDEQLYDLEQTLADAGRLDRTVIVVFADNGFLLGEHRQEAKVRAYEQSIHTDLWIRYPGLTAPFEDTKSMVSSLDVTATLYDLAGVAPIVTPEGKSVVPLLQRSVTPGAFRTDLHASMRDLSAGHCPAYHLIRTIDRWKYVEYDAWTSKSGVAYGASTELYDLSADPAELRNLAASTKPGIVARKNDLAARLARMRT